VSTLPIVQSVYELTGTGQQIGGVSAETTAEVQRRIAQVAASNAARAAAAAAREAAAGNGAGGVGNGAGPFIPSRGIPDNFFGFVMIALGMR